MSSEKSSSMHTKDSQSIASWPSSITLRKPAPRPQPHYETYLLRLNPALKTIKSTTSICSLPIVRTYTHLPASYYIKPLRSSSTEIKAFLDTSYAKNRNNLHSSSERGVREIKSQRDRDREAEERARSTILKMDDDAQREIQKLLEAREVATSGPRVKRVWDVVAIVQRWRRRIHDDGPHPHHLQLMNGTSGNEKKRFRKRKEEERPVEWVLVLKAEAVDFEDRVMPTRYGNPFDEDDSDGDY
ncbi:hypothetical protein B7463_g4973, partial [Scytalidium lignicola]